MQLDISNAFLHRTFEELVFMKQIQGFIDPNFLTHVSCLRKALWQWFKALTAILIHFRFIGSKAGTSLYIHRQGGKQIYYSMMRMKTTNSWIKIPPTVEGK